MGYTLYRQASLFFCTIDRGRQGEGETRIKGDKEAANDICRREN
jgi:hypothetical protein